MMCPVCDGVRWTGPSSSRCFVCNRLGVPFVGVDTFRKDSHEFVNND